jgi:hypothetical protein
MTRTTQMTKIVPITLPMMSAREARYIWVLVYFSFCYHEAYYRTSNGYWYYLWRLSQGLFGLFECRFIVHYTVSLAATVLG